MARKKRQRNRNQDEKGSGGSSATVERAILTEPALQAGSLREIGQDGMTYDPLSWLSSYFHDRGRDDTPMPLYQRDTRALDQWISRRIECVPFLSGMIDQASMIHSNRHYKIAGGKRTVDSFRRGMEQYESGEGFRALLKMGALCYYESNFGFAPLMIFPRPVTHELIPGSVPQYEFDVPPVDSLVGTDPTLFQPTNDWLFPWLYNGERRIGRYDIFRVASMPSTRAETRGIGRCPAWRCIDAISVTKLVYHFIAGCLDPEQVKALLIINGISEEDYSAAVKRAQALNAQGKKANILTLFGSKGHDADMRLQLLSRMPDNLDLGDWLKWALTEFSIHLGFPLEEFIGSHASTLLGQSGSEVEAGERRASAKGGGEFIIQFTEKFRKFVVPDTLHFEFAERDSGAELRDLEIKKLKSDIIVDWYTARRIVDIQEGERVIDAEARQPRLISVEEARRWAVEEGVMPAWMTEQEEDVTVDDTGQVRMKRLREAAMESEHVRRSIETAERHEPIVQYENWVDGDIERSSSVVLWESAAEAGQRQSWPVASTQDAGTVVRATPALEKRRALSDAIAESFGTVAELFTEAISTQYNSMDIDAILEALDDTGVSLADVEIDDLVPLVEANSDTIDGHMDEDAIIGALVGAGLLGRNDINDDAPETNQLSEADREDVGAEIDAFVAARVESLAAGDPDIEVVEGDFAEQLPSLDAFSYTQMARGLRSANDSEGPLEEVIGAVLATMASERAERIAENEIGTAYGYGSWRAAERTQPLRKEWLPSSSSAPREIHIAQYGDTVDYNSLFASGEFWSQTLPFCQCGIKLHYS